MSEPLRPSLDPADLDPLREVLGRSRELGLLGPGPLDPHIEHALAWSGLIPRGARVLDLGSGGGVPGLPLAVARPDCTFTLLDGSVTRGEVLAQAVEALAIGDRVTVHVERAEPGGHDPELRGGFDAVVSRSFGAPPVTAECAAPFLRVGGVLLVSEPPDQTAGSPQRWPAEALRELGIEPVHLHTTDVASLMELRQVAPCPPQYPRPTGRPTKRPLF